VENTQLLGQQHAGRSLQQGKPRTVVKKESSVGEAMPAKGLNREPFQSSGNGNASRERTGSLHTDSQAGSTGKCEKKTTKTFREVVTGKGKSS